MMIAETIALIGIEEESRQRPRENARITYIWSNEEGSSRAQ